jgi:hypothetical protein
MQGGMPGGETPDAFQLNDGRLTVARVEQEPPECEPHLHVSGMQVQVLLIVLSLFLQLADPLKIAQDLLPFFTLSVCDQ